MAMINEMRLARVGSLETDRRAKRRRMRKDLWTAVLFLLPSLLFLTVFVYVPSVMAFGLAFWHYHLLGVHTTWAGISNFTDALQFNLFQQSLWNTFYFAALMVPGTLILSVSIALLIQKASRYYSVMRTLILLPYATPAVGTAIGWLWIFDPTYGMANGVLHWLGLPESGWLQSPSMAMPSIVIYSLWHGVGFDVVIVMSAIAGLPKSVLEAAAMDGGGRVAEILASHLAADFPHHLLSCRRHNAWRVAEFCADLCVDRWHRRTGVCNDHEPFSDL